MIGSIEALPARVFANEKLPNALELYLPAGTPESDLLRLLCEFLVRKGAVRVRYIAKHRYYAPRAVAARQPGDLRRAKTAECIFGSGGGLDDANDYAVCRALAVRIAQLPWETAPPTAAEERGVLLAQPTLLLNGRDHYYQLHAIAQVLDHAVGYTRKIFDSARRGDVSRHVEHIRSEVSPAVRALFAELNAEGAPAGRVQDRLREVLHALLFFENYVFMRSSFVVGAEVSAADLYLYGCVARPFRYFFTERLRRNVLPLLSAWFGALSAVAEVAAVFRSAPLCLAPLDVYCRPGSEARTLSGHYFTLRLAHLFRLDRLRAMLRRRLRTRSAYAYNVPGPTPVSGRRSVAELDAVRQDEVEFHAALSSLAASHYRVVRLRVVGELVAALTAHFFSGCDNQFKFICGGLERAPHLLLFLAFESRCAGPEEFDCFEAEAEDGRPACPLHPNNAVCHVAAHGFAAFEGDELPAPLRAKELDDIIHVAGVRADQVAAFLHQFTERNSQPSAYDVIYECLI